MAQDTTPAIVVYQGTGSDAPFSIPFDKGYYGEIKVLFVRRGLANYTYYPDTYVVSGRLYAWQNGNTRVFTHTPRPSVGAVIYTDEDVAPVTSITLKDLSDNENIYLRSAEDDVLVRRLYAWKYENTIVYTDTPTPKLSSIVTDYQWHQLALRIVSLTNIVVSAISGQTITVDEVIYTRAVQHDISNNLLLTWTGDTLEVGDFICIIRDTERGQPYEMPINQKHVEFALDNLERQIQELKDATDSALKVDPSYDIEDSHKMNPIQWLETILRSMDKSVRAFRYADGWLDYSLDDPNIAEIRKTWRHLLSTENIKNIREASRVLDDKIIYWTEYQDREGNWKPLCKPDEWDSKIDEALEIAEESRDISNEAKDIANDAVDVANNAVSIANEAKATAESIEDIAEEAKDIAQDAKDVADEALDKVTQEITDREDADSALQDQITINKGTMDTHIANISNPHSVTKAQVGLGNVDNTSDLDKPISTATQAALDGKMSASVKYGATIVVSLDNTNYKMTTTLKDQDGNTLGSAQVVDLPLESVVVSGSYDSVTKEVVLTLQGGSTIRFSVADLVSGLQTEITSLNMLSADLVDDTNTTHKFVTTTEKTTWNNKQNAISDLATIRSNAQAGKAASDTIATYGNIVTHNVSEFATAAQGAKADTALQAGDNVSELMNDAGYLVMSDLINFVTKNTAQTITGLKTFSADITLSGTTSIKNTTNGVSYTMLYRDASGIHVGTSTQALLLAGSNARPKFNNNDIAMLSDIPTAVSQLTNDTGFITNAVNDLQNYTLTSNLATVATTGDYDDLLNKPTIPAAQVNSDWNANSGVAQILNKPTLATVATSGSYNDLSDKPTIPTVNNATLTIQKNGTTVQTFTANQSTNATANISVPTKTSDITNDSGFITSSALAPYALSADLATVATTGDYDDLLNKPTIPAAQVNSDWNAVSGVAQILNKPTLGTMASESASDYVEVAGDTMTGSLTLYTNPGSGLTTNLTFLDKYNNEIDLFQDAETLKVHLRTANKTILFPTTSGTLALTSDISVTDVTVGGTSVVSSGVAAVPAIPTVNDATITITQGGVTKGSFTLNQATGDTIDLDAGGGSGSGYHPDLFDVKWADHICNDVQWLRADTFSWQSGSVYQVAYQHLADDIDGKTLQSETVAGTTIQFYLADDGHKICPASEESNVSAIYNATGVAWYYIIDTANTRFKLPRTQFAFTGIRSGVGAFVEAGLPNITDTLNNVLFSPKGASASGARRITSSASFAIRNDGANEFEGNSSFDASQSSAVYGNSDTVQPKATEMYLYFYVGNFTQTALENTAGITTEEMNEKADLDLVNVLANIDFVVESQLPTADNGYTWYRKYKSGWVEQGGSVNGGTSQTATFPIAMADTNYTVAYGNISGTYEQVRTDAKTTTNITIKNANSGGTVSTDWQVSGMAA